MRKFIRNLTFFTFGKLDPTLTGSYQDPLTEEQLAWMPEDGMPVGDEPLIVPDFEEAGFVAGDAQ